MMMQLYVLGSRLMRRLPGPYALAHARYWRDMAQLSEAEVALVSFPKSGRTFVRVMLARLYQQQFGIDERDVLSFAALRAAAPNVPRLLFTHNGSAMRPPAKIRIDRSAYAGRKVVLLARHPGDIAVSRYFHLKHRSADRSRQRLADQPLEQFIWTRFGGIPSIVTYLNQWAEWSREREGILIVRYEDFVSDPNPVLARLAEFIGLDADRDSIAQAVEFASFENLKAKERAGYFTSSRFGPGRDGSEGSYKVRTGGSGGFRKRLDADGQERVQAYVSRQLDPLFGYSAGDGD